MRERLEQQEIRDTNNNTRNNNKINDNVISGMIHSFEKTLFKRIVSSNIVTIVKITSLHVHACRLWLNGGVFKFEIGEL